MLCVSRLVSHDFEQHVVRPEVAHVAMFVHETTLLDNETLKSLAVWQHSNTFPLLDLRVFELET